SYKEVRESDEKWERERRDNLVNVNNRRDARRLSELEKVYDDTRLKELQKRYDERGQLAGKDAQDYDRLSKLKPEYDRLKEGVGNYRKSQLESFKASEVESIVKYLKESQLKNLQESTKFTEQEKNKFQKEWAEKAFDAPLKKANEQVLELRKLNATLKKQNITLSHLDNRLGTDTEPRHATINMKVVSDMKDELNPRMEALKDEIRKAPRGEEHMEKRRTLRDLQKAAKKLEDLESHLKNVGPDIGGTAEGKSFDTSKVS
ncbi:MAG: hypothetical protein U1C66_00520, partial [Patescibacteria group bacterium]|nr:hypothetical protein [Patescibacteria group bacterium]